jgi:DNA polymerase delta subunit 3
MPDAPVTKETSTETSQPKKAETPKEEEPEPTVTVQNGRRRGKRRVMKKKTVKDEEGYLGKHGLALSADIRLPTTVTKEEAVWESFSEDEPEPKRAKPAPKPAAKGKPVAKKGQGSIASFFKKA